MKSIRQFLLLYFICVYVDSLALFGSAPFLIAPTSIAYEFSLYGHNYKISIFVESGSDDFGGLYLSNGLVEKDGMVHANIPKMEEVRIAIGSALQAVGDLTEHGEISVFLRGANFKEGYRYIIDVQRNGVEIIEEKEIDGAVKERSLGFFDNGAGADRGQSTVTEQAKEPAKASEAAEVMTKAAAKESAENNTTPAR